MNYEEFISEVMKYWDLRSRGLNREANSCLYKFTERFRKEVSEKDGDEILFQFCREYVDELKYPGDHTPRRHIPFQLTKLLNSFLNRACDKNEMPQMRWAFEIFGRYYNPHDPTGERNPYEILERAYAHELCDQKTVDLYFQEQINFLCWGQHHIPEGSLITREEFEGVVQVANNVLGENSVAPSLVERFHYYVKLYQIYFDWFEKGRKGDFREICRECGLEFQETDAYYYK